MTATKLISLLKPKRSWLQYRLRTLFVLVVIAAVPCVWLEAKIDRKARERAVVAQINKGVGRVYYDWELDQHEEPYGPVWVRNLFGDDFCSNVIRVIIHRNGNDDLLGNLSALPDLEDLLLIHDGIDDARLARLGVLPRLRFLAVRSRYVTDVGLSHIAKFTGLQSLHLYYSNVTDVGLVHLKDLTQLEYLNIDKTGVTNNGIATLQKALPNCRIER